MTAFNWRQIKKQIFARKLTPSSARFWLLVIGLIALWGLIWLGVTTQAVVTGQRVRELNEKLERVTHENAQLEYEIAALTQPKRNAERATALGLRPATPSQTVYLTIKYNPRIPAIAREQPPAAESSRAFDLIAWWNDSLAAVGIGTDVRSVEASPLK